MVALENMETYACEGYLKVKKKSRFSIQLDEAHQVSSFYSKSNLPSSYCVFSNCRR